MCVSLPRAGPRRPPTPLPVLLALSFAFAFAFSITTDAASPPLRYQFQQDSTNVYQVTLDSTHQDVPVSLTGTVHVLVRAVTPDAITLLLRGSILPRPGSGPHHGIRTPGPLDAPMGWFPQPIHIPHGTQITVDDRGRVVRESGVGIGFPLLLGRLGSLLLEPLPEGAAQEVALDGEMLVDDEWPAPGGDPGPPIFHGGPWRLLPQLTARRTGTSRITRLTDTSASLAANLEIASLLQSGPTPRLTASIARTSVFDRQLGLLRSLEITGTSVFTSPTITFRRPFAVHVRLLQGEELARELQAQAQGVHEPPSILSSGDLASLLADLDSGDPARRSAAVQHLRDARIATATPDLTAAALRLVGDPDLNARMTGQRLLGQFGGEAEVPGMIRALIWSPPGGNQRGLIEGLGRLRDPRAIEPLADLVARGNVDVEFTAETLRNFGPAAEPAALRLLGERHAYTRRLACELLGHIGSDASLEALHEAMGHPDPQVSQAATEALRSVRSRNSTSP